MNPKKRVDYNIYNIKKGDTIENIALRLGQEVQQVRNFHNIYAKQEELISLDFPIELNNLYITPEFSEKKIDNIPKVNFIYDSKIDINPSKKKLLYNVNNEITIGKEVIILNYQMGVQFVEKIQNQFLFEISKQSPFEEVDNFSMMQELDSKILDAIYPLQVYVNNLGFCTGIANFEVVEQRFKLVKKNILDEFEGQNAIDNINFYQTCFNNESEFKKILDNDIFINSYFAGIYENYNGTYDYFTKGYFYEKNIGFPILMNIKPTDYKTQNYIEPYLNDDNLVTIERMGILNDNRALLDFEIKSNVPYYASFEKSNQKAEGNLTAIYTLDSITHTITTAKVQCTIELYQERKIKCEIQLVSNV